MNAAPLQVFVCLFHLKEFEARQLFCGTFFFQVACQSLGPLEKGGSVLGVDVKVRALKEHIFHVHYRKEVKEVTKRKW